MLKAITLSLILFVILSACKKPETDPGTTVNVSVPGITDTASTATERTYLALGDSYTIGQSVAENERFPVQTVTMLNAGGIKYKQPEIIAQTGWTTGNLLSRLDNSPPLQSQYDIVTLLIGVNNQYQGRTQEEYRQQFTTLLQRAIQYAGNNSRHVIVLSIPDYGVTPFASGRDRELIAKQIDSFNTINKDISMQYGTNYIDITPDTRLAINDPSLIASDGLHPSRVEYAIWAGKLAPMIRVLLR
jgi:lysophospholipase L1-like esterase